MTWSDPEAAKVLFETDDVLSEGNISTYLLDNLLATAHPLDYSSNDVDVANTVTETSLWSKVIAGNALGAAGRVTLEVFGDFLFNNAGSNTITLRVKWGGATLFTSIPNLATDGATINANRKPWSLRASVGNRGATNAQYAVLDVAAVDVRFETSANGANGTTASKNMNHHGVTTAAVDTTASQTLEVTAQWSAASANLSYRKRQAILYLGRN